MQLALCSLNQVVRRVHVSAQIEVMLDYVMRYNLGLAFQDRSIEFVTGSLSGSVWSEGTGSDMLVLFRPLQNFHDRRDGG
jgi:hypothetical protein